MENEQYQNIIELLKLTLQFYAKETNWSMKYNLNDELVSTIEMDEGEQARQTLEQVEKLELLIENLGNDYEKLINEAQNQDVDQEQLLKDLKDKIDEATKD